MMPVSTSNTEQVLAAPCCVWASALRGMPRPSHPAREAARRNQSTGSEHGSSRKHDEAPAQGSDARPPALATTRAHPLLCCVCLLPSPRPRHASSAPRPPDSLRATLPSPICDTPQPHQHADYQAPLPPLHSPPHPNPPTPPPSPPSPPSAAPSPLHRVSPSPVLSTRK